MRQRIPITLGVVTLLLCSGTAGAERLMTWIDADGMRHFSQSPPSGPVRQLRTLELEPPAPAANPDPARLDTIRAVARELEAARLAREAARASARPATPPAPAPEPERVIVVPAAPYGIAPPLYPRPPHYGRDRGHDHARDRDHRTPDGDRPKRRPPALVLPGA